MKKEENKKKKMNHKKNKRITNKKNKTVDIEKEKALAKKRFNESLLGKIFNISLILGIAFVFIGLIIEVFEMVINIFNLEITIFEKIFKISNILLYNGSVSLIYILIIYLSCTPIYTNCVKESKKKTDIENTLIKFVKYRFVKILIGLFLIINVATILYKVGYIIGVML